MESFFSSLSYENVFYDDDIKKWTKKWDQIKDGSDVVEKLAHTQKYFRMLLSAGKFQSQYYYSFCDNDVHQENCYWHCIKCKTCDGWRNWHCGRCDKCKQRLCIRFYSLPGSLSQILEALFLCFLQSILSFSGTYGVSLKCGGCGGVGSLYGMQ